MELKQTIVENCPACFGKLQSLCVSAIYPLRVLNAFASIDFGCCSECHHVLQLNPVCGESLSTYYAGSPRFRSSVLLESEHLLYGNQARFMNNESALAGASVLDFGADMGKLLDRIQDDYGCKTSYIEHNDAARDHLASEGRHSEVADLSAGETFDWIVLSQVLEHIVDPVSMLSNLQSALKANGRLFIEVPNHSFWDDLDYGFSFEHVSYFSSASLSRVMENAGYVVTRLEVTTEPRYFGGQARIIRAAACPSEIASGQSVEDRVREHNHRGMAGKFDAVAKRARVLCEGSSPRLALYGAGELAEQLLANTDLSAETVVAIFDSDARKIGIRLGGIEVMPAAAITEVGPVVIVIMSGAEADIARGIETAGYVGEILPWSRVVPSSR